MIWIRCFEKQWKTSEAHSFLFLHLFFPFSFFSFPFFHHFFLHARDYGRSGYAGDSDEDNSTSSSSLSDKVPPPAPAPPEQEKEAGTVDTTEAEAQPEERKVLGFGSCKIRRNHISISYRILFAIFSLARFNAEDIVGREWNRFETRNPGRLHPCTSLGY